MDNHDFKANLVKDFHLIQYNTITRNSTIINSSDNRILLGIKCNKLFGTLEDNIFYIKTSSELKDIIFDIAQ